MATIVTLWPPPAGPRQPHYAWVRGLWDGLRSCSAGAGYVNHLEADEGHGRVRQAYGEPTYQRLVAVKNRYDPGNLFRLNPNIRPTKTS